MPFAWLNVLLRGVLRAAALAVPDIGILLMALALWLAPRAVGVERLPEFLLVFAFEFVAVHAAGVLSLILAAESTRLGLPRWTVLLAYLAAVSALVAYVAVRRGEAWPFFAFWGVTGNRLVAWYRAPDVETRRAGVLSWVFSPIFYVRAALLTTFVPVPALGMTADVAADAGLVASDGLWSAKPERGLACAAIYYALQAWWRRRQPSVRSAPQSLEV